MKEKISRRDWLIRVTGLGALGAIVAKALKQPSGASPSLCERCGIVPWCDRPEAADARRAGRITVHKAAARNARPLCEEILRSENHHDA